MLAEMAQPARRSPPHRYIVRTPGTCGGRARVDRTRIPVWLIVSAVIRAGRSPEEFVEDYPRITLSQVHDAPASSGSSSTSSPRSAAPAGVRPRCTALKRRKRIMRGSRRDARSSSGDGGARRHCGVRREPSAHRIHPTKTTHPSEVCVVGVQLPLMLDRARRELDSRTSSWIIRTTSASSVSVVRIKAS